MFLGGGEREKEQNQRMYHRGNINVCKVEQSEEQGEINKDQLSRRKLTDQIEKNVAIKLLLYFS